MATKNKTIADKIYDRFYNMLLLKWTNERDKQFLAGQLAERSIDEQINLLESMINTQDERTMSFHEWNAIMKMNRELEIKAAELKLIRSQIKKQYIIL